VCYFFGAFPVVGFLIFATKVIGLLPIKTFKYWFMNTQWLEFVYNGQVRRNLIGTFFAATFV
jgi:hypothetical protein